MILVSKLDLEQVKFIKNKIDKLTEIIEQNTKQQIPFFKGNKKEYHLIKHKDYLNDVLDIIKSKINKDNLECFNTWVCYGTENCYHELHIHNEPNKNKLATILYLDVPNNDGGEFYYVENNKTTKVKPEIGTFIIFPIHLLHGSYPQGEGIRQTFNMDFEYND